MFGHIRPTEIVHLLFLNSIWLTEISNLFCHVNHLNSWKLVNDFTTKFHINTNLKRKPLISVWTFVRRAAVVCPVCFSFSFQRPN